MSLSKRYGYFRCHTCNSSWESAHVYCTKGTNTVQYTQDCKNCKTAMMPYRVEELTCKVCHKSSSMCKCPRNQHHVDPSKHHPKELCAKCRAGLPCT